MEYVIKTDPHDVMQMLNEKMDYHAPSASVMLENENIVLQYENSDGTCMPVCGLKRINHDEKYRYEFFYHDGEIEKRIAYEYIKGELFGHKEDFLTSIKEFIRTIKEIS